MGEIISLNNTDDVTVTLEVPAFGLSVWISTDSGQALAMEILSWTVMAAPRGLMAENKQSSPAKTADHRRLVVHERADVGVSLVNRMILPWVGGGYARGKDFATRAQPMRLKPGPNNRREFPVSNFPLSHRHSAARRECRPPA
ncbi:MAG TPA: hypothetical protein VIO38_17195 [Rariglobus sp.]